jgi:hypothetical protein
MAGDVDLRAFDALSENERIGDIAGVSWDFMVGAVDGKSLEERTKQLFQRTHALQLTREEATTPFGNALDILHPGPDGATEHALARALAAHAFAVRLVRSPGDYGRAAAELLWLAGRTPFDGTGLLDRTLASAVCEPFWAAMAERIRRADQAILPGVGCGDCLVAAIALAVSDSECAGKHRALLASEVCDPKIAFVLSAGSRGSASTTFGEMAPRPRGSFLTALAGLTGVVILVHLVRFVVRFALSYRKPAEVVLGPEGDVRVRWRTELLGRTLREHDVLLPRAEIARAVRDVRYPALGLYAGLLALTVGSFVGVSTMVDGVRAGSPSIWEVGAGLIALGIAIDFVLSSLNPGRAGRCRVLLVPRRGGALCVGGVDLASADAFLDHLGGRPRRAARVESPASPKP